MREFLLSQMDFILFIYGAIFILLFPVCLSLQKNDQSKIPWKYLGYFGLLHGITEWLDIWVLSFGDNGFFASLRLFILVSSFICLLEFARLVCQRLKSISLGRWVHLPLLIAVFSAFPSGATAVNVSIRYSFAFIGGLWSAFALWRISAEKRNNSLGVGIAAAAMLVYALAAGLVVPKAGLIFASVINQDSFLKFFGFPVQLLRTFSACVISGMLWRFYEKLQTQGVDAQIAQEYRKQVLGLIVTIVSIISLGWVWTQQAGRREDALQRARLLSVPQQILTTIDPELVKDLNASASDLDNASYQVLKDKLRHLHNAIPSLRFIYLMRKVNGKVVFLVDSEPPGSKDESPPGQVYEECSPKLKNVFISGKSLIEGPTTDRWGTWVSAYTPLNDGRTGELIAALGIDQSAQDFNRIVAFERFKCIVCIGLFCLAAFLVFGYWRKFNLFIQLSSEGKRAGFLAYWGIAVIVGLVGGILTAIVFLQLQHNALDVFQTTFVQRAIIRVQSVSQELDRQLDRLDGLRRFMGAKDYVERSEFVQYVTPFLKGVPVRALEWIPRVSQEERIFYESSAKQDGLEGFQIYEMGVNGRRLPVAGRDAYFPVYYLEPLKGNETALGFDLASEPARRAAMDKSRDTGQPVATPPLVLIQEGQKRTGVLIFMPVYSRDLPSHTMVQRRRGLKGFVLAVYNADELLKGVYSKMPPEGLACLVEDLSAPEANRVLYRHQLREGTVDWNHVGLKYVMPVEIPDRQWRVRSSRGQPLPNDTYPGLSGWYCRSASF